MKKTAIAILCLLLSHPFLHGQVIIDDVIINNANENTKGVGRTAISVATNGNIAVAWQDFNDYNIPVAEQPRIAVQMFTSSLAAVGPLNVFKGESRTLAIWTSDFLEPNPDIAFTPDGSLLVAVEHEGRFSIGFDDVGSSEAGIGVVSSEGQIIDFSNSNGVIRWLIPLALEWAEHPRIAVAPTGDFFVVLDGKTYDSGKRAVYIQQFAPNGDFVGDFFLPHTTDPSPQAYHRFSDVATNSSLIMVVWQDSRQDENWDISAQFYSFDGPMGSNVKVNQGDAVGVLNIWSAVAMNANGVSIVVWADTRDGDAGEIYGQLYNASGNAVGDNFKISSGQGEIWDRPEVAIRNDNGFMVVWTDSSSTSGLDGLRARGRQYDSQGNSTSAPFIVPNQDVASGLINVACDGSNYYLSWLDDRLGDGNPNVYFKAVGGLFTSVEEANELVPSEFSLEQNYPNPFNPQTVIQFAIPKPVQIKLTVFDLLGKEQIILVNQPMQAGVYKVDFNGKNLPSGVYFYSLEAGEFKQTRQFTLLK